MSDEATNEARSIGAVVGGRLRRLRAESKDLRRQDDVAARVRELVGLPWSQATIAGIESGRRDVGLDELIALSIACDVTLPEWFEGDGTVTLSPDSTATFRAIRAMLGQDEDVNPAADFDLLGQRAAKRDRLIASLASAAEERRKELLPLHPRLRDPLQAGLDSRREAEQKAAVKFSMDPLDVSVIAHVMWSRGLTDERERRVNERAPEGTPPRRLQAIRGHVTRELLHEFQNLMEASGVEYSAEEKKNA